MRNLIKKHGKYMFLHFALVIYSITSVLLKFAGNFPVVSWQFILIYGGAILLLLFYAVLWQQVLKRMPLSVAFANKSIVIIWGIIWGVVFFQEEIHWKIFIGIALIVAGIVLVGGQEEDV